MNDLDFVVEMLEQDLVYELSPDLKNRAFDRAAFYGRSASLRIPADVKHGRKEDAEQGLARMKKRTRQANTFLCGVPKRDESRLNQALHLNHMVDRRQKQINRM